MTLMNRLFSTAFIAALISAPAFSQTSDHSQMNHAAMDHDAVMQARILHMIEAIAVVKNVNKKDRVVSLAHAAIPAISWPAMTMKFPVGGTVDLDALKKGQSVQFTLHRAADGSLPLVELCPTVSEEVIAGLCAPDMNHGPKGHMKSHDGMNH